MADKVRVGIVGATTRKAGSGWGANAHIPALRSLSDYELVAVCTAHEESAKESAQAFGARLAFHDPKEMVSHPDVDLVAVVVRVPRHAEIVALAAEAGKAVFCEWPLAASLAEAQELAALAAGRRVATAVGLQSRSDGAVVRARELLGEGAIGEVLAANLQAVAPNDIERPAVRMWQGDRKAGANPLTIAGGHNLDALRFLLGDFAELRGRVVTRIGHWTDSDTGEAVAVDAPDAVSVAGVLQGGAEVAAQILAVPGTPPSYRLQVYGTKGSLQLSGVIISGGPNELVLRRGFSAPEAVELAHATELDGVPPGPARNVAAAYVRLARALQNGEPFDPSFADAVKLHALLDGIERGEFTAPPQG